MAMVPWFLATSVTPKLELVTSILLKKYLVSLD